MPPGSEYAAEDATQGLRFRPRLAAWFWIIPISLSGLVLAGCNFLVLTSPEQADGGSREYFVAFGLLGAALLAAPLANYVNAEVRFAEGVVSKRGLLRRTRNWQASDLTRIHSYVRWTTKDFDWFDLDHNVYRFLLRNGATAFDLSEAWWKTSDIRELAGRLKLEWGKPSEF